MVKKRKQELSPNLAEKPKGGRPTMLTEELGRTILDRMMDGESLRKICDPEDMPARQTVMGWALDGDGLPEDDIRHWFAHQYARAEQIRAMQWAQEVIEISDDGTNDFVERQEGGKAPDKEHINRSRLRVDSRKWVVSKLLPKVYGDKLKLDADVNVSNHEKALEDLE